MKLYVLSDSELLSNYFYCVAQMAATSANIASEIADPAQPSGSQQVEAQPPESSLLPDESRRQEDGAEKTVDKKSKSNLLQKIEQLKAEQKQLREEKRKCASEMKNAMRKKRRIMKRAGQLNDEDFMEAWKMRVDKKSETDNKEWVMYRCSNGRFFSFLQHVPHVAID